MQLTMALAVVTPTRDCVATSPLKGEVEFPLLPSGESDCLVRQAFCHGLLSRMMALRMVRSLRIVATMAT
ncbi:hypothetical protein, partial [Pararhizobium sp. DWP3-4]|uniref:hypothetical protein n=1 Tax=Pararhizobium sp. DWP3-4 TaxID=2804565 RepID=UPI003CEEC88A